MEIQQINLTASSSANIQVIDLRDEGSGGGGSTRTPILVANVKSGDSFPTKRPDGTALIAGDYVKPYGTFPFTIGSITFTSTRDEAVYTGSGWLLNANPFQNTAETPVANKATESLAGTSAYQANINIENVAKFKSIDDNAIKAVDTQSQSAERYATAKAYSKGDLVLYNDTTSKSSLYIVTADILASQNTGWDKVEKTNCQLAVSTDEISKAVISIVNVTKLDGDIATSYGVNSFGTMEQEVWQLLRDTTFDLDYFVDSDNPSNKLYIADFVAYYLKKYQTAVFTIIGSDTTLYKGVKVDASSGNETIYFSSTVDSEGVCKVLNVNVKEAKVTTSTFNFPVVATDVTAGIAKAIPTSKVIYKYDYSYLLNDGTVWTIYIYAYAVPYADFSFDKSFELWTNPRTKYTGTAWKVVNRNGMYYLRYESTSGEEHTPNSCSAIFSYNTDDFVKIDEENRLTISTDIIKYVYELPSLKIKGKIYNLGVDNGGYKSGLYIWNLRDNVGSWYRLDDATKTILSTNGYTDNAKMWRGTQAEYDAITTKDANTHYFVENDPKFLSTYAILQTLYDGMYPIGARMITIDGEPHVPTGVSAEWELDNAFNGYSLWINNSASVGSTNEGSLPNITAGTYLRTYANNQSEVTPIQPITGAFYRLPALDGHNLYSDGNEQSRYSNQVGLGFDASRCSGVYNASAGSNVVRPTSVNARVYKRTK